LVETTAVQAADPPTVVETEAAISTDPDGAIEVTVTGDRGETKPATRDLGVASSVITRANLEAPGLQAQDVLRTQPGVIVTESGGFGAPATACVRGASAADTPVYLAGIRLNDDVGGTADLSMIPLWLIHHVELYRGNAPLDADRLGAGGALFFEPKRPTKTTGGVGYTGGSWGTSRYWAYNGSRQGRVSYLVGFAADRASNRYSFVNDEGMLFTPGERHTETRRNADARTYEGWFLGRADLGKQYTLDWVGNVVYREQGVPKLALLQSRASRQATTRELASIGVKGPLGSTDDAQLEARVSLVRGLVEFDDPLRELALYTSKLTVDDYRVEQMFAVPVRVSERLRLRPVVQFAYESIERNPNDIPLGQANRQWARLAGSAEYELSPHVVFRGLVSGDCHHTKAKDNGYCDELAPTGRLGTEFRFGNTQLFASAGRYLRVPTLGENYGISGTVHGNRELEPETGETLDVGLRTATHPSAVLRKLYLDAFVFSRWANKLVAYTRTGQGFVRPYNVDAARVLGAELLGGSRITEWLGFELSATFMDPRDVSSGRMTKNDVLPYRSKLIISPRLRLDWSRHRPFGLSGAGGRLSTLYQSSRYADSAGTTIIDEQLTTDLEGYVQWFDGLLTVRGRIADLFDARRTDIVGYPLPGRSFYFGLEAQY
jgi:iron complex outermembrane receptor protein